MQTNKPVWISASRQRVTQPASKQSAWTSGVTVSLSSFGPAIIVRQWRKRVSELAARPPFLKRFCRITAEHHGSVEEREPSARCEARRRRVKQVIVVSISCVEILHVNSVHGICCCPKHIFPLHLQDSPLILQSDRNVTVNARNDQGQLTGQLTVGKTNTRHANAAVYDCSMLPWLQTLSVKSKLDNFIPDSHLYCFACAWFLKCIFTAFSLAK